MVGSMNSEGILSILNLDTIIAVMHIRGPHPLSLSFLICKVVTLRGILLHKVVVRMNELTYTGSSEQCPACNKQELLSPILCKFLGDPGI